MTTWASACSIKRFATPMRGSDDEAGAGLWTEKGSGSCCMENYSLQTLFSCSV